MAYRSIDMDELKNRLSKIISTEEELKDVESYITSLCTYCRRFTPSDTRPLEGYCKLHDMIVEHGNWCDLFVDKLI
jgi:hypothetical protein